MAACVYLMMCSPRRLFHLYSFNRTYVFSLYHHAAKTSGHIYSWKCKEKFYRRNCGNAALVLLPALLLPGTRGWKYNVGNNRLAGGLAYAFDGTKDDQHPSQ